MRLRWLGTIGTALSLMMLWAAPGRCQLSVVFANPEAVASPASTIQLEGSIQNVSSEVVFLTGISTSLSEEYSQSDPFVQFNATVPATLGPDERWNGVLLTLTVSPTSSGTPDTCYLAIHGGPHAFSSEVGGIVAFTINDPVAVSGLPDAEPSAPIRMRTSPNPFSESTEVFLSLEKPGLVTLIVYDTQGRVVQTLLSGEVAAGDRSVTWDGRDQAGRRMPNGIYYFHLRSTGAGIDVKSKTLLLR